MSTGISIYDNAQWLPVSTYTSGDYTKYGVCIHDQEGTSKDLRSIFESRKVSTHYSIGDDYCYQYVAEKNKAWATGTSYGNGNLINIELRNSALGPDYPISKATEDNLIQWLVGVAKQHGWKQYQTTDKYAPGYATIHSIVCDGGTSCPDPYVTRNWRGYISRANAQLSGPAPIPKATPMEVWTPNQDKAQQWLIEPVDGSDTVMLHNIGSGKYLDVTNSEDKDGTRLIAFPKGGTLNQQWRLVKSKASTDIAPVYLIESALAGKRVADVYGSQKDRGTRVDLFKNNDTANQQWTLAPITVGGKLAYIFTSVVNGLCLDVTGGK